MRQGQQPSHRLTRAETKPKSESSITRNNQNFAAVNRKQVAGAIFQLTLAVDSNQSGNLFILLLLPSPATSLPSSPWDSESQSIPLFSQPRDNRYLAPAYRAAIVNYRFSGALN